MAQVSAQKCAHCDEKNGFFFCYECQHVLCAICRKTHGRIPALSEHTITNLSTVDLSIVNRKFQCSTHEKEFLYFCINCSDLICTKCVLSTHNTHPVSEITDIVVKEREKALENIHELKLKIDAISTLRENIHSNHLAQLHSKSTQCITQIESISKELQSYLESKRRIRTTEVEDKEKIEQQNFDAFLKNTDLVHKQYTQVLSELENLVLEKHDVTFYTWYKSILNDMHTLVDIPDEPALAEVPLLEDTFLHKEVMKYIESKIGKSLCQDCPVLKSKIEDLHSEYKRYRKTYQSDLKTKSEEIIELSELVKSLKNEKKSMQSKLTDSKFQSVEKKNLSEYNESLLKEGELKAKEIIRLSEEIKCLKYEMKTLQSKELEQKRLSQEIQALKVENQRLKLKDETCQRDLENKKISYKSLMSDLDKKNIEMKRLSEEIQFLKKEDVGMKRPTFAKDITVFIRMISTNITKQLTINEDETVVQLFQKLARLFSSEAHYVTFSKLGKQFCYDASDRSKITDIGLRNGETIYVGLRPTPERRQMPAKDITIFVRTALRESVKRLTINQADSVVQLFQKLSSLFSSEAEYISFFLNGERYPYDANNRKSMKDIKMFDESTICVVIRK